MDQFGGGVLSRLQDLARLLILFELFDGKPELWLSTDDEELDGTDSIQREDDRRFLLSLRAAIREGVVDAPELRLAVLQLRDLIERLPRVGNASGQAEESAAAACSRLSLPVDEPSRIM